MFGTEQANSEGDVRHQRCHAIRFYERKPMRSSRKKETQKRGAIETSTYLMNDITII